MSDVKPGAWVDKNVPATALVTFSKIHGPIEKIGPVEKAFEVYECDFHAFANIEPGPNGELQKNGNSTFSDFKVSILEAVNVPNFAQSTFHGTDVGTVTFWILTTVGQATSQELFKVTLINARGTSVELDSIMVHDEDPSARDMQSDALMDSVVDGEIKNLVEFSKDYVPPKMYYNVSKMSIAYDEMQWEYTKYETDSSTPGKVAGGVNLQTMTVT